MVALGDGEVGPFAVVADVRVDGDVVLGLVAQVPEQLGHALVAVLVFAEGVDDPDLSESNGTAWRGKKLLEPSKSCMMDAWGKSGRIRTWQGRRSPHYQG